MNKILIFFIVYLKCTFAIAAEFKFVVVAETSGLLFSGNDVIYENIMYSMDELKPDLIVLLGQSTPNVENQKDNETEKQWKFVKRFWEQFENTAIFVSNEKIESVFRDGKNLIFTNNLSGSVESHLKDKNNYIFTSLVGREFKNTKKYKLVKSSKEKLFYQVGLLKNGQLNINGHQLNAIKKNNKKSAGKLNLWIIFHMCIIILLSLGFRARRIKKEKENGSK